VVTDENLHERSSSMQRMDLAVNGSGGGLLLDSYFSLPDFLPEERHSSVTGMSRNRNSSSSSSRAFAQQSSAIRLYRLESVGSPSMLASPATNRSARRRK